MSLIDDINLTLTYSNTTCAPGNLTLKETTLWLVLGSTFDLGELSKLGISVNDKGTALSYSEPGYHLVGAIVPNDAIAISYPKNLESPDKLDFDLSLVTPTRSYKHSWSVTPNIIQKRDCKADFSIKIIPQRAKNSVNAPSASLQLMLLLIGFKLLF